MVAIFVMCGYFQPAIFAVLWFYFEEDFYQVTSGWLGWSNDLTPKYVSSVCVFAPHDKAIPGIAKVNIATLVCGRNTLLKWQELNVSTLEGIECILYDSGG